MTEQAHPSLSLDDVSRRFADSERALAEARERLQSLTKAEESASLSATSLQEASASVIAFAQSAAALIGELEQAQRQSREVLEAGARFLDGTELRELKEAVTKLASKIEGKLDQVEHRVGEIQELRAEMERRTAKLSSRQRKQLGLS